jgi:A/G-specific adenine glycosylase
MYNTESHLIYIWYQQQKRDLPWRNTTDSYTVWVSEVILHQTRVSQGLGYFNRFLEAFPDVATLAAASLDEVLQLWQGLGYYRRAQYMHQAAGIVMEKHNGIMPSDYQHLITLPGIGDYTASLISSVSSGESNVAVDGNVGRFIARWFDLDVDPVSSAGRKVIKAFASGFLTDKYNPGLMNNALMEFGALQCIPRNPNCAECVLAKGCNALLGNTVHLRPLRSSPPKVRKRFLLYEVINWFEDGDVWYLVRQRDNTDIWAMMWEFPCREEPDEQALQSLSVEEDIAGWCNFSGAPSQPRTTYNYKHQLTHQQIHARFVVYTLPERPAGWHPTLTAVTTARLEVLAKPVLITRFLKDHQDSL